MWTCKLVTPTLFVLAALSTAPAWASNRYALLVGNNEGLFDEHDLRYAESDAKRVGSVITRLGGFDSVSVDVLLGAKADGLRGALTDLAKASKQSSDSVIFFYYSGHSDGRHLHMAGTKMPIAEVEGLLSSCGAKVTLVLVDACKSGAFTRTKGARPGPSYAIDYFENPEVEGRVVITSSSHDESSQESDRLESSFFTHHWVSGLYGQADTNGDGVVTLDESYRFAHYRTIEDTSASSGGVQHPSYRHDIAGRGSVVLTSLRAASASIQLAGDSTSGEYLVLDGNKLLVLTELVRTSSGSAMLRVPPGQYRIQKRAVDGLRAVDIELVGGEMRTVHDREMVPLAYAQAFGKGEAALLGSTRHGPSVAFGMHSGIAEDMGALLEVGIGYRLAWDWLFIEPRLELRTGSYPSGFEHTQVELGGVLGARLGFGAFGLGFGVDGGLLAVHQHGEGILSIDGPPSYIEGVFPSLGLAGRVLLEGDYSITERFAVFLRNRTGGMLLRENGTLFLAPVFAMDAGVAYQF